MAADDLRSAAGEHISALNDAVDLVTEVGIRHSEGLKKLLDIGQTEHEGILSGDNRGCCP